MLEMNYYTEILMYGFPSTVRMGLTVPDWQLTHSMVLPGELNQKTTNLFNFYEPAYALVVKASKTHK